MRHSVGVIETTLVCSFLVTIGFVLGLAVMAYVKGDDKLIEVREVLQPMPEPVPRVRQI